MPKKMNKKVSAPLPSALTVANPADFKPESVKEAAVSPSAAQKRAAQPRVRKPVVQRVTAPVNKANAGPNPARPADPGDPPSVDTPSRPDTRAVEKSDTVFLLFEPEAHAVALCGSFNDWSPEATPMKRQQDGCWTAALPLAPGQYQYKFLVDGQWLPDPRAHENVSNQFGTLNSVIEVSA